MQKHRRALSSSSSESHCQVQEKAKDALLCAGILHPLVVLGMEVWPTLAVLEGWSIMGKALQCHSPTVLSAVRACRPVPSYRMGPPFPSCNCFAEKSPHLYSSFLCVVTSCPSSRAVVTTAVSTLSLPHSLLFRACAMSLVSRTMSRVCLF